MVKAWLGKFTPVKMDCFFPTLPTSKFRRTLDFAAKENWELSGFKGAWQPAISYPYSPKGQRLPLKNQIFSQDIIHIGKEIKDICLLTKILNKILINWVQ